MLGSDLGIRIQGYTNFKGSGSKLEVVNYKLKSVVKKVSEIEIL